VVQPYYLGNPDIGLATEAALCAHDQGQFFEYEHVLYERQGAMSYDPNTLTQIAAELGLDTATFSQCLSNRTHRAELEQSRRAASRQGVNSTPTFFINKRRLEGNRPYEDFQRVIEAELAAAK